MCTTARLNCDSIGCELAGSHALLEALPGLLGPGVRVKHAPCVGRCEAAPVAVVPAFTGLVLELLYDRQWELLAFAGISLLAGFVFQLQVAGAVRLAVDDPELRASYGSR